MSGKSRPPCPQTAVPLAGPPPGPVSVTVRILWHLAVRLFLLGVRRRLEFWVGIQHLPSNPATSGSHIPTRQATLPCLGFEPSVIIPSLLYTDFPLSHQGCFYSQAKNSDCLGNSLEASLPLCLSFFHLVSILPHSLNYFSTSPAAGSATHLPSFSKLTSRASILNQHVPLTLRSGAGSWSLRLCRPQTSESAAS